MIVNRALWISIYLGIAAHKGGFRHHLCPHFAPVRRSASGQATPAVRGPSGAPSPPQTALRLIWGYWNQASPRPTPQTELPRIDGGSAALVAKKNAPTVQGVTLSVVKRVINRGGSEQ